MIQLKEPWEEPVNGKALIAQFERELHQSRSLYKHKGQFRAFAKNESNDDVIFEIREMGYVLVHLTWSSNALEVNYPVCRLLAKDSDVQNVIDNDNLEYQG